MVVCLIIPIWLIPIRPHVDGRCKVRTVHHAGINRRMIPTCSDEILDHIAIGVVIKQLLGVVLIVLVILEEVRAGAIKLEIPSFATIKSLEDNVNLVVVKVYLEILGRAAQVAAFCDLFQIANRRHVHARKFTIEFGAIIKPGVNHNVLHFTCAMDIHVNAVSWGCRIYGAGA